MDTKTLTLHAIVRMCDNKGIITLREIVEGHHPKTEPSNIKDNLTIFEEDGTIRPLGEREAYMLTGQHLRYRVWQLSRNVLVDYGRMN